jgi:arylsulfatase A-like enzyme
MALAFTPLISFGAERPNVILVMTDDQGIGDLGIHGNDKIKTPNLDKFGREGIELTRFYVSPVCAPTRAELMTGRNYYRTGVIHTSRGGAKMHTEETTIAELLGGAGYRTGLFGKWHLGDNYPMRPQEQGFQEVLMLKSGGITQPPDQPNAYQDPILWHNGERIHAKGYCTDVFFGAAMKFIEENRQKPFFAYIALNAPHTPLEIGDDYVKPYKAMGLDDTTAKVYGMVQNIDENFGRLVAHLDKLKLRENTLLIFMTDNGPQQARYTMNLRGRKTQTYEGGNRVPFFIQWPAKWKGSRQIDRLAANIDILPTLLDVCGVKQPKDLKLDGMSLLPLLTGTKTDPWPDRVLFFQVHRSLTPKLYQNFSVVSQRWKMVGSPGTFGREDFIASAEPVLEMYDLSEDGAEAKDVAKEHSGEFKRMRAGYEKWFAEMQAERGFKPGDIHIGNQAENPVHLCYYQDASWVGSGTKGWQMVIEKTGKYKVSSVRDPLPTDSVLVIN